LHLVVLADASYIVAAGILDVAPVAVMLYEAMVTFGDLAFLLMVMSDAMVAMMLLSMMTLLIIISNSHCCHFNGITVDRQSDVISRDIQVTGRDISECVDEMELVVPGCWLVYFALSL